jgi:nucleotide-binding universal stress UspA family protein
MFQHILVPLDGSTRAEQVLPVAARLARASQGKIMLVRVIDLAHNALSYGMGAPYIAQNIIEDDFTSATHYLEHVCQYKELAGIAVETQVVGGNAAEAIVALAVAPIDLIVISSHGYSGMKRWLLGSVAEKVAQHSLVPVLLLRDGEMLRTHRNLDRDSTVRALAPLDNAPRSQDALVPAAELVAALSSSGQGELHLTQMVVPPGRTNNVEREALLQQARRNLSEIGQNIRDGLLARFGPELHPALSWSVSETDDIAEGVVLMAENGETDAQTGKVITYNFIALTTHGAGGLPIWPIGSIAARVLHNTRLPVLLVRPEDMIAKERSRWKHHAQMQA